MTQTKTLLEQINPEAHHKLAVLNHDLRTDVASILREKTSYGDLTISEAIKIAYALGVSTDMRQMRAQLIEENIYENSNL